MQIDPKDIFLRKTSLTSDITGRPPSGAVLIKQHCVNTSWIGTVVKFQCGRGESPGVSTSTTLANSEVLTVGNTVFLRGKHANWLSNNKLSLENIHTSNCLNTLYVCVYVCVRTSTQLLRIHREIGNKFEKIARMHIWESWERGKARSIWYSLYS